MIIQLRGFTYELRDFFFAKAYQLHKDLIYKRPKVVRLDPARKRNVNKKTYWGVR
jgi:hypothetical protein